LENHYSTWTTQTINFSESHVSEEISSDSINSEESDLEDNALLEENGFVDGFFVSSNLKNKEKKTSTPSKKKTKNQKKNLSPEGM